MSKEQQPSKIYSEIAKQLNRVESFPFCGNLDEYSTKKAAELLEKLFIERMAGFAEWADDNYWGLPNGIWCETTDFEDGKKHTTKELVQEYLNQLPSQSSS